MTMNMNSHILDEHVRYEGGFCMGDDIIDLCYYPPPPSPTMLFEDNNINFLTSQDLLLQNPSFPAPLDHRPKIDMAPTEDVLLYFNKDPAAAVSDASTTDVPMMDVTSSSPSLSSSLVLPCEGILEISNELTVFHLLAAYAEAVEMGQEELSEVIGKRIGEKVTPVGDTIERLIYYMFHASDKQQPDYLKQESVKNFLQAFKAMYQIFPHGKFAHFTANLAILESLPEAKDVRVIQIFDFDIGEGIQWASLIEAIGHNYGGLVELRITSVHFGRVHNDEEEEEEEQQYCHSTKLWRVEDTKKRLSDYARSYGISLKVDEIEWNYNEEDTIQTNKEKLNSSTFYVFNCMVGLPHMGRVRSRRDVLNFLQTSQHLLQRNGGGKKGIITFGDGDGWDKVKNASNYTSFLDENMAHYQALLESIKVNFPSHLGEARTAMECLFVAPLVSCKAWAEKWMERKKYSGWRFGMEGLSLSRESLMEAKEVVREGESLYGVRVEGERHNELVMEWRGIPMVKVSCWRN